MIYHIFWSFKRHQLMFFRCTNIARFTNVEITWCISVSLRAEEIGRCSTKITYQTFSIGRINFLELMSIKTGSFGARRFPATGAEENMIVFGATLGTYGPAESFVFAQRAIFIKH